MKLYFAPNSRAVRVAWLLEELGIEFEIETYGLGDKRLRTPEYATRHPLGRVPVLEDGDVRLFESGAIIQYLLARHGGGRFLPETDAPEFPVYLQWFHYAEGMIMPPINTIVVETILLPPERRNEVNEKRARKLLNQMLSAVEAHMEGRDYLAGEISGADFMTGHACHAASLFDIDMSDKPNLAAYLERLRARPALQKVLAL